jgi:hypothetical protein
MRILSDIPTLILTSAFDDPVAILQCPLHAPDATRIAVIPRVRFITGREEKV